MAHYLDMEIRKIPVAKQRGRPKRKRWEYGKPTPNAVRQVDFADRYNIPAALVKHLAGRGYFAGHSIEDDEGIPWITLDDNTRAAGRRLRDLVTAIREGA